jgi:acyl-coenzyme A synthetase/AMP-(fatty) acid ligase
MGYRVELGEIEARLRAEPNVVEAIAAAWPVHEGTAQGIVAFVSGPGVDAAGTRENVARSLPDYMVPSEIHLVEEMPLNANGKIDRNALVARLGE